MIRRLIAGSSPIGLLATGLAFGVMVSPALRKGLRGLAVKTAKAGLVINDQIKSAGGTVNGAFKGIVDDARKEIETSPQMEGSVIADKVHVAGVAAMKGGLGVADQIKETTGAIKEKWNELIIEARGTKQDLEDTGQVEADKLDIAEQEEKKDN